MKEIYFIRHGETDYNKRHIIQGSGINSSLNETGRAQGKAFYEHYKSTDFEIIFVSALQRTRQTVTDFIGEKISTEEWKELNEIGWGDSEGKESTPEDHQIYKNMINEWAQGNLDASMKNGESAGELIDRLTQFVNHLKTRSETYILVCTHGRAMRCLMTILKNEHPREMEKYKHANTGLFKATFDGKTFDVVLENDIRHLE